MPSNCKVLKTIEVPVRSNSDFRYELQLMWFTPYCGSCEREGKACGLKSDDGQTICVSPSRGTVSLLTLTVHVFMQKVLTFKLSLEVTYF